mmetsp:Transcript_58362/g.162675  ORF Transcript_58362/g.162675 Transcript_58362/m.162675 type:complete len:287 (+) Transcript_58362:222-1082(+)
MSLHTQSSVPVVIAQYLCPSILRTCARRRLSTSHASGKLAEQAWICPRTKLTVHYSDHNHVVCILEHELKIVVVWEVRVHAHLERPMLVTKGSVPRTPGAGSDLALQNNLAPPSVRIDFEERCVNGVASIKNGRGSVYCSACPTSRLPMGSEHSSPSRSLEPRKQYFGGACTARSMINDWPIPYVVEIVSSSPALDPTMGLEVGYTMSFTVISPVIEAERAPITKQLSSHGCTDFVEFFVVASRIICVITRCDDNSGPMSCCNRDPAKNPTQQDGRIKPCGYPVAM